MYTILTLDRTLCMKLHIWAFLSLKFFQIEPPILKNIIFHSLQARVESNLRKILQKNRRCHFDKRDAPIWKLALFSFFIGVQARSPISQLRDEIFKKFQKWEFSSPNGPTFDYTQLFSKISPSGQKLGFRRPLKNLFFWLYFHIFKSKHKMVSITLFDCLNILFKWGIDFASQ